MSEGAYGKIDALKKVPTVRQVLSRNVFLNFQHLHPEFQMFILRRIQSHYVAKKDIQSDVTFFLVMSVSTITCSLTNYLMFQTFLWFSCVLDVRSNFYPLCCLYFGGLVSAVLLSTFKTIQIRLLMFFIQSSTNGCSLIIITWKSYWTSQFPSAGYFLPLSCANANLWFQALFRLCFLID